MLSKLPLFWQLRSQTQQWCDALSFLLSGQGFKRSGSVCLSFFLSSAQTSCMTFSKHEQLHFSPSNVNNTYYLASSLGLVCCILAPALSSPSV